MAYDIWCACQSVNIFLCLFGSVTPTAVVLWCISALLEGQEDQSILISGVSGAGKTETAKLLLGHLASVAGSEEGGVGSERIQHMVECTVVLESFGNAVMVRGAESYCIQQTGRETGPSEDLVPRAIVQSIKLGVVDLDLLKIDTTFWRTLFSFRELDQNLAVVQMHGSVLGCSQPSGGCCCSDCCCFDIP